MNLLIILILMTAFTTYVALINHKQSFVIKNFKALEDSKKRFYKLEGIVFYAISYLKSNFDSLVFPVSKNILTYNVNCSFLKNKKLILINIIENDKKVAEGQVNINNGKYILKKIKIC